MNANILKLTKFNHCLIPSFRHYHGKNRDPIIVEQDERSMGLNEFDPSLITLASPPWDKSDGIFLDARFFEVFWTHQDMIPKSWKGEMILFPGTVFEPTDKVEKDERRVLCLFWFNEWSSGCTSMDVSSPPHWSSGLRELKYLQLRDRFATLPLQRDLLQAET